MGLRRAGIDRLRATGKDFDVLVMGAGIGGLATAAQLARAGLRVCVVDRYHTLGGYAHALNVGGFDFCHQVQYLMGCEEHGPMRRFLQRLGLESEVGFNEMDPAGYDVVVTPELRFAIPHGQDAFRERLTERFPEHRAAIHRYFGRLGQIWQESHAYERILHWGDVIRAPWKHMEVLRSMRSTLGEVFDQLKLPPELRVILAGQAGNLSAGPAEMSFLMHCGMQEAYSRSAAYPKRGMRDFVAKIAGVIEASPGCRIIKSCNVQRILTSGGEVEAVVTDAGRLTAGFYVSNLDPQRTYQLVSGGERQPQLHYDYSDAVVSLYAGFDGTDLRAHGFGKRNFWFHAHHDLDREFTDLTQRHKYDQPWIFLSTPSLLADPGALCKEGSSSLVMLTFISYKRVKELEREGAGAVAEAMGQIESTFWKVLDRHFLKGARQLATVSHLETPLLIQQKLAPAEGNVYGARLTPHNYNLRRVTSRSAFANLRFANATAFFPGVMPITVGSMQLVDELLGARMAEQLVSGGKTRLSAVS